MMALSNGGSFAVALISAILIFSGMQMYKPFFTSNQICVLFAGYLGSLIFTLTLTALGNLETCIFGKAFQLKVFPEVIFCMACAIFSSGSIHRISATTCLLISILSTYYINKHSQKEYNTVVVPTVQPTYKKRR